MLRQQVEQLDDFDRCEKEVSIWLDEAEKTYNNQAGLKATFGLKKSQLSSFQVIMSMLERTFITLHCEAH